ncbi:MAG: hypothetical protein Q6363_009725, partial [Candidatus Njordarchaeota archaeon]
DQYQNTAFVSIKRLNYVSYPGGGYTITIVVPKSFITNLADHIWIQAHTYFQRNEDWTAQDTAPVPEFALIALLVIPIASFFVYKKIRKK